jgi:VIT1/CCC1 family predicted Fe2+/Mn2+ transporter
MKQSERIEDAQQRIDHSNVVSASSQRASPPQSVQPAGSFWEKVWKSLDDSIGEIVFGMEDGTVSIFGLVFGLAASATNSHEVLLAGATGAAAAAVSMMAGTYLDVESTRAKAQAEIEHERQEIQRTPQEESEEIRGRLINAGFDEVEVGQILTALKRRPEAMLKFEEANELQIAGAEQQNPVIKSLWMLLADLFAASIPVIPFALFALATARTVSLVITLLLLVVLGIARGLIGRRNVLITTVQTVVIAAAAAAAGVLIGKWISG